MDQKLTLAYSFIKRGENCVNDGKHNPQEFRDIIDSTLKKLRNNKKNFEDDMLRFKDQMTQMKERIEHLEHDLQSTSNVIELSDTYSQRLVGGRDNLLSNSPNYESVDDPNKFEEKCEESEKLNNYNKIVAKYTSMSARQTFRNNSSRPEKPLSKSRSDVVVSSSLNMHFSPDSLTESVRRVPEQRQHRLNMLTYHKSHFSLSANCKKYNFMKTLDIPHKKSKSKIPRCDLASLLKRNIALQKQQIRIANANPVNT